MATRGPKPKPTALRKLEGNPGGRAYNAGEPQIPTVDPSFDDVPALLTDDPVAAAEWSRLAPLLRKARVLTDADRNALIAYCQQWSIYQDALTNAPAARRILRSPNDYPLINPFLSIANKALMFCDRIGEQLGMTPSGRSRVHTAGMTDDAFAEFDRPIAPVPAPVKGRPGGPTTH